MDQAIYLQLAIALGLGLLVGLEREWEANPIAGIRTFPLITVLGMLCAMLARLFGGWILAAGLIALAAFLVQGNLARFRQGRVDPGVTTDVAVLVMFAVGAALAAGYMVPAIAVGGGVAVLLYWKRPLHEFVGKVGEADLKAIIRLVLIAAVILPVLPNRPYGPYHVLNPFQIWLMVVLIVGISLGAYVAYKLLGERIGSFLAGVLGGLISSSATTVSLARLTRRTPDGAPAAAAVIMIASTIVFGRILLEIALVNPAFLRIAAPPLIVLMAFMVLISAGVHATAHGSLMESLGREPPSDLKVAIVFGLLYAVVIFAVAAAKAHLGNAGLYAVAALSGLPDVDAITLSTAQLVKSSQLSVDTGWRLVMVGAMTNLVFKGAAVAVLGHPRLLGRILVLFGLSLAGGAALLALWPPQF